jgi:hypothetical protein
MFRSRGCKGLQPSKVNDGYRSLDRDLQGAGPKSVSLHRLHFCCGLAMNWRGVARGPLIIEPKTVLCWALAKLREAQVPPLQVFRVPQSKVDANFPPSRRLQATLSLAPRFLLPICRRPFPQVP